ncbi:MAG TPA: hypothetical protein VIF09_04755 [Polyangiaceae bacterium]|jgi:hypothetical protein
MKRAIASMLILAVLAGTARARAQETVTCERRLTPIALGLQEDARRTRVWYWTWMSIGTALLVGQGVVAAATTGDTRIELGVGSAASVFIPGLLLVHPPRVLSDGPTLDARLAATTVDGRVGDPCIALLRARELLERDADDEALATGWFAHVFVIGGNVALGLLLGIGFHDWLGGVKQLVGGSLVGEAQILTLPGRALQLRGMGFGGTF